MKFRLLIVRFTCILCFKQTTLKFSTFYSCSLGLSIFLYMYDKIYVTT